MPESRHAAPTASGRFDLWHRLQVPGGGTLVVPFEPTAHDRTPLSYALEGEFAQNCDHLLYEYSGSARTKLGLAAAGLTEKAAIVRALGNERFCLIVREFRVDPNKTYGDHPYGAERTDQAFQAWDEMGFEELQHHSPILDAKSGPRQMQERDFLWGFWWIDVLSP